MSDSKIKANLYIDGNFTVHIHKYLTKVYGKTIDWKSFLEYVKDRISKEENKVCVLQSQFFVGTGIKTTDEERDYLFNSMEHEGIVKHATPLKQKVSGGLKEDAVDTNLVFFATQDYYKREQYDYLVLLAGDSDFVPLVKGLSAEAVKTFVIYMDFEDNELGKTQTAQALLDETNIRESIETLRIERVDPKIKKIFKEHVSLDSRTTSPEIQKETTSIISKKTATSVTKSKETTQGVVKEKQTKKNSSTDIPFTKEQLEAAIKTTQKNKTNSQNDFVLVAHVGENMKDFIKQNLHGRFFNMIRKNFSNDFEFDLSEKSAPRIKFKNV